jgi:biopolymer transport protein ExbD
MKLARRAHRTPPETIIALIDVVLFLLIFFMLIGRLDATAPFEVTPPVATAGSDMPGGGATVSVSMQGAFALDGVVVTRDELLKGVAEALARDPDLLIRLNADRETRLRDVLPLAGEFEALGAGEVVLVITPNPQ